MKKPVGSTKIRGFSLAEALIALLVVCLITIASVPVLTKKKKDITKNVHGKWICTIKDGSHHVWTSNDRTWTNSGSSCTFIPPMNARNFAVTAVGGGGGGAGATKFSRSWQSDFRVEYYGKYKMAAVGAGGEGGKADCGTAGGGGAGGVGYLEYVLDENALQIKMSAGIPNDTGNRNGGAGGSSVIYLVSKNNNSGNNDTIELLRADGGGGGGGRWKGFGCNQGSGDGGGQGGVYGVSGYQAFNSASGNGATHCKSTQCHGRIAESGMKYINDNMKPYDVFPVAATDYALQIGKGGLPTSALNYSEHTDGFTKYGRAGIVMVTTEIYGAGAGGSAAPEPAIKQFYPSFDAKKLEVTVGAGGKGGTEGANGGDGGTTNVGNFIVRLGGKGGKADNTTKAYILTPGGDGGKSPLFYNEEPAPGYGGLSGTNSDVNGLTSEGYGAGGGGGGVKPDADPGNGADGSPGVVIIEW